MNKKQEVIILCLCIERVITQMFWEKLLGGPFTYYMGQYAFELGAMVILQQQAKTLWIKKTYGFFVGMIVYGIYAMVFTDPFNPEYNEWASMATGTGFFILSLFKNRIWRLFQKLLKKLRRTLKK